MAARLRRENVIYYRLARIASALVLTLGAALAPFGTNAPAAHAAPANFVYRDGKSLMLNGKPYKFVGYNYFALTGCAHGAVSTAAMEKYFAGLRPLSTTRVWAFKAQGLDGVIRTTQAAEKYNQKVIFALGDGAQYCNDTGYNAGFYQSGYKGAYFSWATTVASALKSSPAVLGYETMNEPCHTGAGGVTAQNMKDFFQNTAAHIKSTDPNHLVFSGSLAEYDCGGALSNFAFVHSGPDVDGGSLHEYDYLSVGQRGASSHWGAVKGGLDSINKVSYVGETGVGPDGGCLSDADMASAHKAKLDGYMNAGASGVLVWGFDDQKVCGIYSGRQITYGSATEAMFKSYTNANLPTPNGNGTTTPGNTTPVPGTVSPKPSTAPNGTLTVNDSVTGNGINQFVFTGNWQTSQDAAKYDGDDHYSDVSGNSATIKFTGSRIKLYGGKAPHHGVIAISIDGGSETMVDLYAAARSEQELVFTSPSLTSGSHTLVARVTGDKNAASSDTVVSIDKAEITSAASSGPVIGDLNGDGRVNIADLSILLSHWTS